MIDDGHIETKLRNLVRDILDKTKKGEIQWQDLGEQNDLVAPDEKVTLAFQSDYKDKELRIIHYHYKNYPFDEITFVWEESISMQIIGQDGNAIWEFPKMPELWELFEVIRFKVSGVEDLLESTP